MTQRLARLTLRLYPLAFPRRYAVEMGALLDQTQPSILTVFDLVRDALVAHLHPPATVASLVDSSERVRASTSGVLACWVAFATAGFGGSIRPPRTTVHCRRTCASVAGWRSPRRPSRSSQP
jgi:hypothetical protein